MAPTIAGMHESMSRLLAVAREATKDAPAKADRIHTFADLAARMGVSSAVMTNWKSRGLSKDGALTAARKFGCSANYLLGGVDRAGSKGARLPADVLEALQVADESELRAVATILRAHLKLDQPSPAQQTPNLDDLPLESREAKKARLSAELARQVAGSTPSTRRRRSTDETPAEAAHAVPSVDSASGHRG